MLLYATLLVCAAAMGWMVRRYDLHDREPRHALLLAVALGAALMFMSGRVQVYLLTRLGSAAASNWVASISLAAGITEELGKFAGVLVIAVFWRRVFNDPLDGVVYGSFVGLGAAIEESVTLLSGQDGAGRFGTADQLPLTEPIRLMGHLVMGGITAAGIGPWRTSVPRRHWMLPVCLLAGVALHIGWDLVAFSAAEAGRMKPWHTAAAMAMMLGGLVAYRGLLWMIEPESRARFRRPSPATEPARGRQSAG
ncbi:MAG: PrsW family glutamic-type intramembrane protease [Phycisphaerales bacterium]